MGFPEVAPQGSEQVESAHRVAVEIFEEDGGGAVMILPCGSIHDGNQFEQGNDIEYPLPVADVHTIELLVSMSEYFFIHFRLVQLSPDRTKKVALWLFSKPKSLQPFCRKYSLTLEPIRPMEPKTKSFFIEIPINAEANLINSPQTRQRGIGSPAGLLNPVGECR